MKYCLLVLLSFLIVPSLATAEDVFLTGDNTSTVNVFEGMINITLDENASLIVGGRVAIYAQGSDIGVKLGKSSSIINTSNTSSTVGIYVAPDAAGSIDMSLMSASIEDYTNIPSELITTAETLPFMGFTSYGINIAEVSQNTHLSIRGSSIKAKVESTCGQSTASGVTFMTPESTVWFEHFRDIDTTTFVAQIQDTNISSESLINSVGQTYPYGLDDPLNAQLFYPTDRATSVCFQDFANDLSIKKISKNVQIDNSTIYSHAELNSERGTAAAVGYAGSVSEHGTSSELLVENGTVVTSRAVATGSEVVASSSGISLDDMVWSTPLLGAHTKIEISNSSVNASSTAVKKDILFLPSNTFQALSSGLSIISSVSPLLVASEPDAFEPDAQLTETYINLNSANINVKAVAEGDQYGAKAVGIELLGLSMLSEATAINLINSHIVAEAVVTDSNASCESYGISSGRLSYWSVQTIAEAMATYLNTPDLANTHNVEINIDSGSTITGQWSIWGGDATVEVNNHGLLDGRLNVTRLTNSSSGRLGATLSETSSSRITSNFTDAEPYFTATEVSLANGTTFLLKSPDLFGLHNINDTVSYRLLYADQGEWSQNLNDLNLVQNINSPMVDVRWSNLSDDQNLIVTASFLSPEDAGLSKNGQGAALAALADGVFTFNSNPEDWVPNISGAMVMGLAAGLRYTGGSVQSRISRVRGVNSGDELLFTQGLWYEAGRSDAEQDRRNSINGFNAQTTHLNLGYDVEGDNALLGVAYTHSSTDLHGSNNKQAVDSSDHLFSLYGRYDFDSLFIQGVATYGQGNIDSYRNVDSQLLEADVDSRLYAISSKIGIENVVGDFKIEPILSFEYDKQHCDGYQESGGSLALDVDSQDYEIFNIGGGASLERNWSLEWGNITPELTAMIYYDVIGDRMQSVSHFVGGQSSFVSNGSDPAQTSWEFSPSITIGTAGEYPMNFKLSYAYSGKEDFTVNSISGELRFEF